MIEYRMYVDEVGNHDLAASQDPNHRYLSLTGVILSVPEDEERLKPAFETLKESFFGAEGGRAVVLHRKELLNKNRPFQSLRDAELCARFDGELLDLLNTLDFAVVTAVIDKLAHLERYKLWHYHPYHYCQEILVERFVMWLKRRNGVGRVFGESRGRREDKQLKKAFRAIHQRGSRFVHAGLIQSRFTHEDITLLRKTDNVAGLQLADLIAHPSFKVACARQVGSELPKNFGGKIGRILLESKYDRNQAQKLDGYGLKWLP